MNKIDDLISSMCPKGVPTYALGEIGETISGLRGKSKNDFTDGNAPFVSYVDISNNPALNFNVQKLVKVEDNENQNEIKLGDVLVTGSSETKVDVGLTSVVTVKPNVKTYINSFCFIWRPNPGVELLPDFSKHLFRGQQFRDKVIATANGVTRQNLSKPKFLSIRIPIPPVQIQKEIVAILDKISELETRLKLELEAEIEARKLQYAFYRESLFENDQTEIRTIGEESVIWRGRRFVKDDIITDGVPAIHYGEIYTKYGLAATEAYSFLDPVLASKLRFASPGDVVLVSAGETIEDIGKSFAWLGNQDVVIHDACYGIRSKTVDPRYMVHFFNTFKFRSQLRKFISSSKISAISTEKLAKVFIPVPSLERQREIADILDAMDASLNSIVKCLPTEIKARRQQYEYYRNSLLSFRELESA
jgi:type I restriction enzyme S subunit